MYVSYSMGASSVTRRRVQPHPHAVHNPATTSSMLQLCMDAVRLVLLVSFRDRVIKSVFI
jgi:hypothetical protein